MRLVTPRVAEVRWRAPAVTNGHIIKYIVYAIPLGGATRQRRQDVAVTTPQTIRMVWTKSRIYYCSTIKKKDVTPRPSLSVSLSLSPSLSPSLSLQEFSGTATAGNITLTDHSISYQFQVSAAVMNGQTLNEGDRSTVTASTVLFVPDPGKISVLLCVISVCMVTYYCTIIITILLFRAANSFECKSHGINKL